MMGDALAFDSDRWPIWRSVVIVAPRKNGKTAIRAALSLYRLLTSAGRPEIMLAAPTEATCRSVGVRARELAERAGHARPSMSLDVYSHVMPPDELSSERLLALIRG
jgi:phage terminase large subunit-like protein